MSIIDRLKNYLIDGIMREREKNIQICGEKETKRIKFMKQKKIREERERPYMFRNAERKRKNRIRSLEEKKFKAYLKSCQIVENVHFTQEYKTVVDRRG